MPNMIDAAIWRFKIDFMQFLCRCHFPYSVFIIYPYQSKYECVFEGNDIDKSHRIIDFKNILFYQVCNWLFNSKTIEYRG